MSESKRPELAEVPERVTDSKANVTYIRGRFLGKGGFARCYELKSPKDGVVVAGKVVAKSMLVKKQQRDKMAQEIAIHRKLSNEHVVRFISYFEDSANIYVLLELCERRSLMELHKRRKAITEPEARYFTYQICLGTSYMHNTKVVHRDLKLGNVFLNEQMQCKIGDFGLATVLDYDGERKKTLCGTPNYIAPEMLSKKGHSYEVDLWAVGCILYTLMVGKPPFETSSLKETYSRIKRNEYHVPPRLSDHAKQLINRLLAAEPTHRPNISETLQFEFFTKGYMPARLPTTCLSMAPHFPDAIVQRHSLSAAGQPINAVPGGGANAREAPFGREPNYGSGARPLQQRQMHVQQDAPLQPSNVLSPKERARHDILCAPVRPLVSVPEDGTVPGSRLQPDGMPALGQGEDKSNIPLDYYLRDLHTQLSNLLLTKPGDKNPNLASAEDDAEDPASCPVFWISKWVDYSDKYGLGYQLCDNAVGVLFNDSTKMMLDAHGRQVQYTDVAGNEFYHPSGGMPHTLQKKYTLLNYFRSYMQSTLLKTGADQAPAPGDELARLPLLRHWFRTRSAIVLHLTNGTLQLNFFEDHTKVILCPLMGAVSFIDHDRQFRTYKLQLLEKTGCNRALASRLRYAKTMVERMLTQPSTTTMGSGQVYSGTTVSATGTVPTLSGSSGKRVGTSQRQDSGSVRMHSVASSRV